MTKYVFNAFIIQLHTCSLAFKYAKKKSLTRQLEKLPSIQYPAVHLVSYCFFWREVQKQAGLLQAEEVLLTWGACKQYGEQVDAYSDGIEDWQSTEAIGDRVHLWRSAGETCLLLSVQQHYTAIVNQKPSGMRIKVIYQLHQVRRPTHIISVIE